MKYYSQRVEIHENGVNYHQDIPVKARDQGLAANEAIKLCSGCNQLMISMFDGGEQEEYIVNGFEYCAFDTERYYSAMNSFEITEQQYTFLVEVNNKLRAKSVKTEEYKNNHD